MDVARLYGAVQSWVGHWPGGLAIATIISCGIFIAISGVSVATAATIGVVAIPEMMSAVTIRILFTVF